MKIIIKLSTGKKIELTPEEYEELTRKKEVGYVPYYPVTPWIGWPPQVTYGPEYTITCATTEGIER